MHSFMWLEVTRHYLLQHCKEQPGKRKRALSHSKALQANRYLKTTLSLVRFVAKCSRFVKPCRQKKRCWEDCHMCTYGYKVLWVCLRYILYTKISQLLHNYILQRPCKIYAKVLKATIDPR